MKLRIRDEMSGTYFRGMSGIGPMFGAKKADATEFSDGMEAYRVMRRFPLTVLADLVNEKDQPCDVNGRPLK